MERAAEHDDGSAEDKAARAEAGVTEQGGVMFGTPDAFRRDKITTS
jgi:hypothetical protein